MHASPGWRQKWLIFASRASSESEGIVALAVALTEVTANRAVKARELNLMLNKSSAACGECKEIK